jgi:hypothetical protein
MNSTALVDSIGANSGIISYQSASTSTALPASLRSGTTAVDDPFDGIPSKVLVLGMKGNTIVATQVTFSFNGSVVSGTSPGTSDIGLAGTVTATTCTAYTDPTWTVAGIAATIAASPIWIYYDMS